jgi:hypothetical protein
MTPDNCFLSENDKNAGQLRHSLDDRGSVFLSAILGNLEGIQGLSSRM